MFDRPGRMPRPIAVFQAFGTPLGRRGSRRPRWVGYAAMPAEDTYRRTSQAPKVLQLVAVGLAALAGLLILAGGDGLLLRVGGLLLVVAAALVGVAQVLGRTGGGNVEGFV